MGRRDDITLDSINSKMTNLTGKILISTPALEDSNSDIFKKAIIYVCEHNSEGSMGVVLNQKIKNLTFADLLKYMKIDYKNTNSDPAIFLGGPLEIEKGFVLHSTKDFSSKETVEIGNNLGITGTKEIVKKISAGIGPSKSLFALGYAGWDAGQLDQEIRDNLWLVVDSDEDLLFEIEPDDKWAKALNKLGIDVAALNGSTGHS